MPARRSKRWLIPTERPGRRIQTAFILSAQFKYEGLLWNDRAMAIPLALMANETCLNRSQWRWASSGRSAEATAMLEGMIARLPAHARLHNLSVCLCRWTRFGARDLFPA